MRSYFIGFFLKMTKVFLHITGLIIGFLPMDLLAQNLIPNPGFEEIFTEVEYQWVQPQGPYYHYQKKQSEAVIGPRSGNYENGICMYNMDPNEYLHVKLLQPLVKDKEYRLEVNARLLKSKSSGAEAQKYISVYFGKERLNTHIPGDLYFKPQVNLKLPDGERFEWFQMVDTFKAKGGEAYLTIGYFPHTQRLENKEAAQQAFLNQIDERYEMEQKKQAVDEDKAWLYLPPDEQRKFLKQQEKQQRRKKRDGKKKFDPPISQKRIEKSSGSYPSGNLGGDISMEVFAVRYYFDDLCLVQLPVEDIEAMCYPDNKPETISAGRVIDLQNVFFETDSDDLLPESEYQLHALLQILEDYPDMRIEIRGYTDNRGDDAYNLDLSERRAQSVAKWLFDKEINENRIAAKGFGKANPIDTNETDAGRARNRRVNFLIVEM